MLRRLPLTLVVVAALLALWPVKADAIRYDLEMKAGAQPVSQLVARWADPVQRPFLEAQPRCGFPLLAPLAYTQDSALRAGCAGPNARSMSMSVVVLLLALFAVSRQQIARVPGPELKP